jgi:macrolide transport system ATP-binding/permease protein
MNWPRRVSPKRKFEAQIDSELRFHIEQKTADLIAQGVEPAEARRLAMAKLGGVEGVKEECREARGWSFLEDTWRDLSYGARMLRKCPGFTIVAVLTLALGIGANTAVVTVVNSLLLRPLPVEQPDRLVAVFTTHKGDDALNPSSYPDYLDLRDRNRVFSGVAGHFYWPMSLKTVDQPEIVMGQVVTSNYFTVLGARPVLGRAFLPEEGKIPGSHAVTVLSYRIWRTEFDSDREIIGKKVLINDYPFTVVGVTPKGFTGLNAGLVPALWVPVSTMRQVIPYPISLTDRYDPWLLITARLKPDVSLAQAGAAVKVLAANLNKAYPTSTGPAKSFSLVESNRNRIGTLSTTDGVERLFALLLMIVGTVLLIACFNVANLHLAKATGRQREIALRTALGASRTRIVRQLLTESVLLSLLGGLGGLFVSIWTVNLLLALRPPSLFPIELNLSPDWRVFLYALLLSGLAGILFGLSPALQSTRPDQFTGLKEQMPALGRSRRKTRTQDGLVVAQIALSLVLLVTTGLFARSLQQTHQVNPGFNPHNALIVPIDLGFGQYSEPEGRAFESRLIERVKALPGVKSTALTVGMPLGQLHLHGFLSIDGYVPAPGERMVVRRNLVGSEYFQAMGIPVLEGRAIDDRDTKDSQPVAVINETMARRYWPGRNPIGKTFANSGKNWQVVGVIKNGKYDTLNEAPQPYFCLPLSQTEYVKRLYVVVRTLGDPRTVMLPVLRTFQQLGPNLPPPRLLTLNQFMEESVQATAGPAKVVGLFGLLALMIAMVGVYGVMSYAVSQRAHEFGVRIALGARGNQILALAFRRGVVIGLVGIAIGFVAALAVSQALAGFLYGVKPTDPLTFISVSLGLMLVTLAACYLPARRATKVDPMAVLRQE